MWKKWLSKEDMNSMVGADFASAEAAEKAAQAVRSADGLQGSDLRVIRPDDPGLERKLEPESRGIAGTLVRAHLVLGGIGLLVGLALSALLLATGIKPFSDSPVFTVSVISAFGLIAGLLLGGLFTLRPDHDPIINRARASTQSGRWFVVVHTQGTGQRERARRVLDEYAGDTVQSI